MEEAVRAQEALAGAYEAHMPALRHPVLEGPPGQDAAPQLLLRELPGALQLTLQARSKSMKLCRASTDSSRTRKGSPTSACSKPRTSRPSSIGAAMRTNTPLAEAP